MARSALCGLLLAGAVLYAPTLSAQAADRVADAEAAYAALDYEACQKEAGAALDLPGRRADRVGAYRLLGLCRAALADTEGAREAFVLMLALDPGAELPEGLSPRFTSSYLEAKGHWVGRQALGLRIEEERAEGKVRVLKVRVTDAAGLIDRIAWRSEDGETSPGLRAAPRMEIEVPAGVAQELVAFDEAEGEVASLSLDRAPDETAGPKPVSDAVGTADSPGTEEPPGSFLASPWLWLGAGAVGAVIVVAGAAAAGAGVYFYEPTSVNMRGHIRTPSP